MQLHTAPTPRTDYASILRNYSTERSRRDSEGQAANPARRCLPRRVTMQASVRTNSLRVSYAGTLPKLTPLCAARWPKCEAPAPPK